MLFFFSHKMVGTFKILTLLASLEEKEVNLLEDQFTDGGFIQDRIKCWKKGGTVKIMLKD